MLSKNRTLVLGIILVVVLVIYFALQHREHEENFRTKLPAVDTATIDRIVIRPAGGETSISFVKENKQWMVEDNDRKYAANENQLNSLMLSLNGAEVIRVAATSPEKWKDFKTTKDLGTEIEFKQDGKNATDVLIGKFDYIPSKNQSPYGQQGEMFSYVRVNNEDEVYAIEGSIALGMGKTADDFRLKQLLHLDKKAVNKLQFSYTDGDRFSLTKEGDKWTFDDGAEPDSATMVRYLNSLRYLNGRKLAKEDPEGKPVCASMTIISNQEDTIQLTAYMVDTAACVIRSSYNPTNPILDEQKKLMERAFVSRNYLKGEK
jgi:hypothetical protein